MVISEIWIWSYQPVDTWDSPGHVFSTGQVLTCCGWRDDQGIYYATTQGLCISCLNFQLFVWYMKTYQTNIHLFDIPYKYNLKFVYIHCRFVSQSKVFELYASAYTRFIYSFIYECLSRITLIDAINKSPVFLAKHLQRSLMELAVISNFPHLRPHRGIELGTFGS